jgi:hypothetical protein
VAAPIGLAALLQPISLPTFVYFSGATSDWVFRDDWIAFSSSVGGVFLLVELVVGTLNHLFPIAMTTGSFLFETYWRSTPEREDVLRELLRSSCWGAMAFMNLALAAYLALCLAAALAGVDELGPAVQIATWVGGIIGATLVALDLLVRYRPPEEA